MYVTTCLVEGTCFNLCSGPNLSSLCNCLILSKHDVKNIVKTPQNNQSKYHFSTVIVKKCSIVSLLFQISVFFFLAVWSGSYFTLPCCKILTPHSITILDRSRERRQVVFGINVLSQDSTHPIWKEEEEEGSEERRVDEDFGRIEAERGCERLCIWCR